MLGTLGRDIIQGELSGVSGSVVLLKRALRAFFKALNMTILRTPLPDRPPRCWSFWKRHGRTCNPIVSRGWGCSAVVVMVVGVVMVTVMVLGVGVTEAIILIMGVRVTVRLLRTP